MSGLFHLAAVPNNFRGRRGGGLPYCYTEGLIPSFRVETPLILGSVLSSPLGLNSRMLECAGRLPQVQVEIAKCQLGVVDRSPYRLSQPNQQSVISPTPKNQSAGGHTGKSMAESRDSAAQGDLPQISEEQLVPTDAAAFSMETYTGEQPSIDPEPARGVPVFVMLPLDTVSSDGVFRYATSRWFVSALECLKASGVRGMAIDVWWGAVERQPKWYDWSGYRQVFELVKSLGLKLQTVMSFHACGGNVGDYAQVPLPKWVMKAGEQDPDLFFTDRPRDSKLGNRNKEYVSIFADEAPRVLGGRSPLECYADFMHAFRDAFLDDIGTAIEEVVIGSGPCGELRYPSYVEANGWRFPGIGEFQCYDRRALASLAQAAQEAGHPEWGYTGPHDAGCYTSTPEETGFFCGFGGSWDTPYGDFFLSWYSNALLAHGERLIKIATSIFNAVHPRRCTLTNHMNSAQSIVNVGPAYGSPGIVQAPQSPALQEASVPADTRPSAIDADLGDRIFSAGDLNTEMVERTMSNLSAMSSDSTADSAADSLDLRQRQRQQQQRQQQQRRVQSVEMIDHLAGGTQVEDGLQQQPPSAAPSTDVVPAVDGNGWTQGRPPELRRTSKGSASLLTSGVDRDQPPPSTRSDDGERRRVRIPDQPAGNPVEISLKVAGIHWWFRTRSHAAELTAGYYNTEKRDGYNAVIEVCARYGAALTLTCVEMCDAQHPPEALCGPEGLLRQVREAAASAGVLLGGENALPCFLPGHVDAVALERVVYNTQAWSPPLQEDAMKEAMYRRPSASSLAGSGSSSDTLTATTSAPDLRSNGVGQRHGSEGKQPARLDLPQSELPMMRAFTFLRLTPEMVQPTYQATWARFMHRMRNNSVRAPGRAATPAVRTPAAQRPSGNMVTATRSRSSLFVPNERGEMVPAPDYMDEMAGRQDPPPWQQQ